MKNIPRKSMLVLMFVFIVFDSHARVEDQAASPNDVCAGAWQQYRAADALWKTGWGLFGAGAASTFTGGMIAGLSAYGVGAYPEGYAPANIVTTNRTGNILFLVGAGVLGASIPCLIVGQIRRKSADRILNEQCAFSQPTFIFSIQSTADGIGFAMQF